MSSVFETLREACKPEPASLSVLHAIRAVGHMMSLFRKNLIREQNKYRKKCFPNVWQEFPLASQRFSGGIRAAVVSASREGARHFEQEEDVPTLSVIIH